MKELLLRFEPVIWTIFGLGIMLGTMLLTGWVLVFGVLAPMGFVPADALSYDRAHALATHVIGRIVLVALIALPLWKGAHHVRSISIDFGGAERDTRVATLLYAIAAVGSILAIVAVVRL
jgi:fumarate reductase subunit D